MAGPFDTQAEAEKEREFFTRVHAVERAMLPRV
jgi:hypothetical protein